MDCINSDMTAIGKQKMKSVTELAGGELCLPQRTHNQMEAARRRRINKDVRVTPNCIVIKKGKFIPQTICLR